MFWECSLDRGEAKEFLGGGQASGVLKRNGKDRGGLARDSGDGDRLMACPHRIHRYECDWLCWGCLICWWNK